MGRISRPKLEKLLKRNKERYKQLFNKNESWTQQPMKQGSAIRTSDITGIPGRPSKPKRKRAVKKFQKRQDRIQKKQKRPKRRRRTIPFVPIQTKLGTAYTPTSALYFSNRHDI